MLKGTQYFTVQFILSYFNFYCAFVLCLYTCGVITACKRLGTCQCIWNCYCGFCLKQNSDLVSNGKCGMVLKSTFLEPSKQGGLSYLFWILTLKGLFYPLVCRFSWKVINMPDDQPQTWLWDKGLLTWHRASYSDFNWVSYQPSAHISPLRHFSEWKAHLGILE